MAGSSSNTLSVAETHEIGFRFGNKLIAHSANLGWQNLYASLATETAWAETLHPANHPCLIYCLRRSATIRRRIAGSVGVTNAPLEPGQFAIIPADVELHLDVCGEPDILHIAPVIQGGKQISSDQTKSWDRATACHLNQDALAGVKASMTSASFRIVSRLVTFPGGIGFSRMKQNEAMSRSSQDRRFACAWYRVRRQRFRRPRSRRAVRYSRFHAVQLENRSRRDAFHPSVDAAAAIPRASAHPSAADLGTCFSIMRSRRPQPIQLNYSQM